MYFKYLCKAGTFTKQKEILQSRLENNSMEYIYSASKNESYYHILTVKVNIR